MSQPSRGPGPVAPVVVPPNDKALILIGFSEAGAGQKHDPAITKVLGSIKPL